MTPARKAALQWFEEKGPISRYKWASTKGSPGLGMLTWLLRSEQLRIKGGVWITLTDKGRRDLHEAGL